MSKFIRNHASLRERADPVKWQVAIQDWIEDADWLDVTFLSED